MLGVNLEIQPPGGQLTEGENLVLICSVAKGTGTITFSWHKDGIKIVGRKTQRSLVAELQVGVVTEHHTGRYYCAADNGHGPIHSKWSTVTVKSKFQFSSAQPWFTSQGLGSLTAMRIF